MIFPNHCQKLDPICIGLLFIQVVYRPIHFGEDNTKSILFSKAKCLKEINISFAGYSIKQHDTADCLGCQIDYKSSGEGMASKS